MIQELSIRVKDGGLTHTISIDTDMDVNLPYDIVSAIEEVVHLTSVNPDIIIENLVSIYGLPDSMKEHSEQGYSYVTGRTPDFVPNIKEPIYVVFDDEKPFVINDIIDDNEWEHFVRDRKTKQWCYLNKVLKEGYKI